MLILWLTLLKLKHVPCFVCVMKVTNMAVVWSFEVKFREMQIWEIYSRGNFV